MNGSELMRFCMQLGIDMQKAETERIEYDPNMTMEQFLGMLYPQEMAATIINQIFKK